jgi:hypothetical protein
MRRSGSAPPDPSPEPAAGDDDRMHDGTARLPPLRRMALHARTRGSSRPMAHVRRRDAVHFAGTACLALVALLPTPGCTSASDGPGEGGLATGGHARRRRFTV